MPLEEAEEPEAEEAVSIRARSFERAMPRIDELQSIAQQVSIRARSFERAMPTADRQSKSIHPFQSAPALSSGRCQAEFEQFLKDLWFQSAPALSSGRCPPRTAHAPSAFTFNPRPLFRAGDAVPFARCRVDTRPSIRARSFERAMPPSARPSVMASSDSIRARSFERAMPQLNPATADIQEDSIRARSFERAMPPLTQHSAA